MWITDINSNIPTIQTETTHPITPLSFLLVTPIGSTSKPSCYDTKQEQQGNPKCDI